MSELGKEFLQDEPVDLDKVLRDVLNMDFPSVQLPVINESPPRDMELGDKDILVDIPFGDEEGNQDTRSQSTVPPETTVVGVCLQISLVILCF